MKKLKLKAAMVEKNINVDEMSKIIGINIATFYRKLNDGTFSVGEAVKVKEALNMSPEDAYDIFLT